MREETSTNRPPSLELKRNSYFKTCLYLKAGFFDKRLNNKKFITCKIQTTNLILLSMRDIYGAHSNKISVLLRLGRKVIASASIDKTIKIWNISNNQCLRHLEGHTNWINCLIRVTTNLIASSGHDAKIIIWDVISGEKVRTITTGNDIVFSLLKFDKETIVSGNYIGYIKLWNINDNTKCQFAFPIQKSRINALALTEDNMLVSGCSDGTITMWDKASKTLRTVIKTEDPLISFVVIKDMIVKGGNRKIGIYNTTNGMALKNISFDFGANLIKLEKHSKSSVAFSSNSGSIKIFDLNRGIIVNESLEYTTIDTFVRISKNVFIVTSNSDLEKTNIKTKKTQEVKLGHKVGISFIISLGLTRIATACLNKTIKIWDQMKRECTHVLLGHREKISCLLKHSPYYLISSSNDGEINVWNYLTSDRLKTFRLTTAPIITLIRNYSTKILGITPNTDNINQLVIFEYDFIEEKKVSYDTPKEITSNILRFEKNMFYLGKKEKLFRLGLIAGTDTWTFSLSLETRARELPLILTLIKLDKDSIMLGDSLGQVSIFNVKKSQRTYNHHSFFGSVNLLLKMNRKVILSQCNKESVISFHDLKFISCIKSLNYRKTLTNSSVIRICETLIAYSVNNNIQYYDYSS